MDTEKLAKQLSEFLGYEVKIYPAPEGQARNPGESGWWKVSSEYYTMDMHDNDFRSRSGACEFIHYFVTESNRRRDERENRRRNEREN